MDITSFTLAVDLTGDGMENWKLKSALSFNGIVAGFDGEGKGRVVAVELRDTSMFSGFPTGADEVNSKVGRSLRGGSGAMAAERKFGVGTDTASILCLVTGSVTLARILPLCELLYMASFGFCWLSLTTWRSAFNERDGGSDMRVVVLGFVLLLKLRPRFLCGGGPDASPRDGVSLADLEADERGLGDDDAGTGENIVRNGGPLS